jgi:hypothetical protein
MLMMDQYLLRKLSCCSSSLHAIYSKCARSIKSSQKSGNSTPMCIAESLERVMSLAPEGPLRAVSSRLLLTCCSSKRGGGNVVAVVS